MDRPGLKYLQKQAHKKMDMQHYYDVLRTACCVCLKGLKILTLSGHTSSAKFNAFKIKLTILQTILS